MYQLDDVGSQFQIFCQFFFGSAPEKRNAQEGTHRHVCTKSTQTSIAAHSGRLKKESKAAIRTAKRRFSVMIIHGEADPILRVSAGRTARDFYLDQKHQVEYVELPNLGHVGAAVLGVKADIWEFFTKHPLIQPPPA